MGRTGKIDSDFQNSLLYFLAYSRLNKMLS